MSLRRPIVSSVAITALLTLSVVGAAASLADGERMLSENEFSEAVRSLAGAAERGAADRMEQARARRGLAVAHLAREEGVQAVTACAQAILLDPSHPGNVGLVKVIERELSLAGVPDGWQETLELIVEAAGPHPVLRDYVIDLEATTLRFRGELDAMDRAVEGYGCIGDYMIAGPFPNTGESGVFERYPPEEGIDLDAVYTDHLGREFGWERRPEDESCYVDLDLFLGDEPNAVAYALTHVRVDAPMEGTASLYGGGAFRLWVNGHPVLRERSSRIGSRSLYEAQVELREGWNRILLKAGAESEPLVFALKFRDSEERTIYPDVDPDPAVYSGDSTPGAPIDESSMPAYTFESLPETSWLRTWRDSLADAPLCDWYSYLEFLMVYGYEVECERVIEECEDRFPGSAVVAGMKAQLLFSQGRDGEAALILRGLSDDSPGYTPACSFVVGEALEQGDLDEAWNKASAALSRSPNNVSLQAMHGALQAARGSVNEGINEMRAAFERRPGNHGVRTLYLILLRMLRGESEYEEALEAALAARPDDASLARQAAAAAFEKNKYDETIEHLRHAERVGGRADVTSLSVGRVLEEAGRLEEALDVYEDGLGVAPRNVLLHEAKARLLQRMGEDERALEHYRTMVARRPLAFSEKELIRRLQDEPPLDDYFPEDDLESLLSLDVSWVDDDAMAVRLHESQHLIVYADGAHLLRRHTVTRILTEAGVDAYGGAATPYYFDSSEGMVEVARTIKSDGREIEADRGLGEVTFADLEPGDVVELRYQSRYGPLIGLPGHFWHRHFFETEIPCARSRLALLTPTGSRYSWELHGAQFDPSTEEADGWRLNVWEMSDVPAATVESRMPPWTECGVWLEVSTIPDWSEIVGWYHGVSRGRLYGGRRAKELARDLSEGVETDHEKIEAVTGHVRKNIKYEGSGFIESGLVPRSLEEVLRTKLGDCKDQSVLLVYLLREMGVEAHVALVNDRSVSTIDHLPTPDFTHAIVRAEASDGSVFWIDPTDQELSFPNVPVSLEGARALIIDVANPVFAPIETDPPTANGSRSHLFAAVDEAGDLTVTGECSYRGEDAAELRFIALYYSEMLDEVKRDVIAAEHPAAVVARAELDGAENTQEDMELSFEFRRSGAVSTAGDLMIVGVPWTVGTVPHDLVSLEQRVHPIILDSWRGSYEETVEFAPPEGYTLASELPSVESDCTAGRFSLSGEQREDGAILLTKKLDIEVFRVEPEDYPQFRAMLETGWRAEEQQLVFERSQ